MKTEHIAIATNISSTKDLVWKCYTQPEHIMKWNFATDEWHCPKATCDLRPGGEFSFRMASRDGAHEFDLKGKYAEVEAQEYLSYTLEDGRQVEVRFLKRSEGTLLEQSFEPESSNDVEMQRAGWQAILDNFKKYVESNS